VEATQVWTDCYVFDLSSNAPTTHILLDALLESTAVSVPISATGGGYLRLVASEDQSSAAVTIPILFSFDG
jgi:hypothetical protein